MKIATFNANSVRTRLSIILSWLKQNKPDILCLQETKVSDDKFPALAFIEAGYNVVFKGEKAYSGVAIASKEKFTDVVFGFDDGGPVDGARLIRAQLGKLNIVNTYVPQGRELDHPMFKYKLEWFHRLKKYFEKHFKPNQLIVWVGDINVAPEPIDLHNPDANKDHVCFHIDVRNAFKDTVSWGFVDVFRKYHPEPQHYSYFDYRTQDAVKRKIGWRVDLILATKPLAEKSSNCYIDVEPRLQPNPSDHTFVVAEFKD